MRSLTGLIALVVLATAPLAAQQAAPLDDRPIHAYLALPQPGSPVPEFDLPLLGGGRVSPASLREAPAVLVMWATWCSSARTALAEVEALRADYAPRGVQVVVLADNAAEELREFAEGAPIRAPVAVAGGALASTFDHSAHAPEADSLRVEFAIPSVLVIDRDGRVAYRGGRLTARLRETLDAQLARAGR